MNSQNEELVQNFDHLSPLKVLKSARDFQEQILTNLGRNAEIITIKNRMSIDAWAREVHKNWRDYDLVILVPKRRL